MTLADQVFILFFKEYEIIYFLDTRCTIIKCCDDCLSSIS